MLITSRIADSKYLNGIRHYRDRTESRLRGTAAQEELGNDDADKCILLLSFHAYDV